MRGDAVQIDGKRFGSLVVLWHGLTSLPRGKDKYSKYHYYNCICDCGKIFIRRRDSIISGQVKHCGCMGKKRLLDDDYYARYLRKTIGRSATREYRVWNGMRQRCLNKNFRDYHRYGGRGITMCERWLEYENFLADMGSPPKGHSLDRIDNNAGYSPDNCRWATKLVQQRNRRNTRFLTLNGETKTLAEWCEIHRKNYVWAYQAIFRKGRNPMDFFGLNC